MLLDDILSGLGSSRSGSSSAPRSGGTPSVDFDVPPLTEEEQNAMNRGGRYSSDGTVERWYIDTTTGRKYYTAGDKAGTWEQVMEPKRPTTQPTTQQTVNTPNLKEMDDTTLFLILSIATLFAAKLIKGNKRKRR